MLDEPLAGDVSRPLTAVTVLGAGLMGHGIAQVFATAGIEVKVWDPDLDALRSVPQRIEENRVRIAATTGEPVATSELRLRLCESFEDAVTAAQVIFEAAPEDLSLKKRLVSQIDQINTRAVLATNTSVLRIGDISEESPHRSRIVGAHWWNPPYLIPVVEVIPTEHTLPTVTDAAVGWLRAVGKTPVVVNKDVPGFIGNRLQFALWREAIHLVASGICDAESVDLVARNTFGLRLATMGPLENADYIGLDLVNAIMSYVLPDLNADDSPSAILTAAVARGDLGAKTGRGLQQWRDGDRDAAAERLTRGILRSMQVTEPR